MKFKTVFFAALLFSIISQQTAAQAADSESPTPLTAEQQEDRDAAREKMRALLDINGPKNNMSFKQSTKQPYNFVGFLDSGLKNADSFEVVIGISSQNTISFRIFPKYKGAYVNIDKVENSNALLHKIALYCDTNFLYWGADVTGDIFAGYNFTLESGFPDESIKVVLRSISKLDDYVGQMRPSIDGSVAP